MRSQMTWNPWQELDGFRREVSSLLNAAPRWTSEMAQPTAFNVYAGHEGVVVTAELPGFDPESFDVSVQKDQVTIRGKRSEAPIENVRYHLRERGLVELEKSFQLPFIVDAEKTEATYERGVLTVRLQKVEEAKPAKVTVRTA
ncbi:MAG: Hsp20/alpha crystallin family protein [Planctomycetota bacterium]|nr:Hsp20/alpha crystallin family protein [Planctomycetaceae bacterium]MDQ3331984.1 Hsp20/alpha crystallin family protein [Planctomycetota bacterium]